MMGEEMKIIQQGQFVWFSTVHWESWFWTSPLETWSWGYTKLHPFNKWDTLIPLWRKEEMYAGDAMASKLLGTLQSAVSWAVTLMDTHIAFGFVPDVIYVATDLAFF